MGRHSRIRTRKATAGALGRMVREARIKQGLTSRETSALIGASKVFVSLLETRGHIPSLAFGARLAALLGVSLDDLSAAAEKDLSEREARS